MSASIKWQPTGNHWENAGSGSTVVEALRHAFGDGCEWVLDRSHRDKLAGMFAATRDETYSALMEAIAVNDAIRVKVQY